MMQRLLLRSQAHQSLAVASRSLLYSVPPPPSPPLSRGCPVHRTFSTTTTTTTTSSSSSSFTAGTATTTTTTTPISSSSSSSSSTSRSSSGSDDLELLSSLPATNFQIGRGPHRPRLVILGGGWAGFRLLKDIDLRHYEVSVVSPRNHFVFTPLLASACSGTLAFRSIIEPIRRARKGTLASGRERTGIVGWLQSSMPVATLQAAGQWLQQSRLKSSWLWNKINNKTDGDKQGAVEDEKKNKKTEDGEDTLLAEDGAFHYYEAGCRAVDTSRRRVLCRPNHPADAPFVLEYDRLVVAVGCDVSDFGIAGVRQHCLFLKEVRDARRIRQRLIECFERASNPNTPLAQRAQLLHFVIVGAGPTGIEAAAEIHDLIESDLRRLYPHDVYRDVSITVLEAGDTVLSGFDESLQRYTRRKFSRTNVRIHTRTKVVEVSDEGTVRLADGSVMRCGMVLWSAGVGPRRLMADHDRWTPALPRHPQSSRALVDSRLRVQGVQDVFALGDCAHIVDGPLPATAQVAQQQGAWLAQYLNAKARSSSNSINTSGAVVKNSGTSGGDGPTVDSADTATSTADEEVPPFTYRHRGIMAYIGDYEAVTDVGGIKSGGFLSFVLWRSAYLTTLVSVKNKIMVPLDWMHTLVFGRDMSQF